MVKGVNKKVIEVNNTGSKFIEKVVLYITPQYSNLTPKQLESAIKSFDFGIENKPRNSLRKRYKRKISLKRLLIALILLFAASAVIFLICK